MKAAVLYKVLPLRNLWIYHSMLFPVMSIFLFLKKYHYTKEMVWMGEELRKKS
jgi:hypothetical protein